MARPLRIEYPDAIYHVTARGNAQQAIVRDDMDRDKWVELLERTVDMHKWTVFAFALMTNHFHIFVQTPEPNLSKGMQRLNGSFAGYINSRHHCCGHLFQGRFKAALVEREGHWLELSRYVHLNPVRVGLAEKPEEWKWSSYAGYHLARKQLAWVDCDRVLGEFGGNSPKARRQHRAFMEEGLSRRLDSPLSGALHGVALGSEAFVSNIREMLQDRSDDPAVPALGKLRRRPDLEAVIEAVTRRFGCDPGDWVVGRRSDSLARAVAAYAARRLTGLPGREIASAVGYGNVSSVSVACRRVAAAMTDRSFAEIVTSILDAVNANH